MELPAVRRPYCGHEKLIEHIQSLGWWQILSQGELYKEGIYLDREQLRLQELMMSLDAQTRHAINSFATWVYKLIVAGVATELVGPERMMLYTMQLAWSIQQAKWSFMSNVASTVISGIGSLMNPQRAAVAQVASQVMGAVGQPVMQQLPAVPAGPMPALMDRPASSASALQDIQREQQREQAQALGQPDQRPETLAGMTTRPVQHRLLGKTTISVLPRLDMNADDSINEWFVRMHVADGNPTSTETTAIMAARTDWPAFSQYLHRQSSTQVIKTWHEVAKLWERYRNEKMQAAAAAAQPKRHSRMSVFGFGANVDTPETLQLQPKAKAKSRAVGGSRPARPKMKKMQLTQPVLPYHDIMNDGYYIK